jgi:hypothetical protein
MRQFIELEFELFVGQRDHERELERRGGAGNLGTVLYPRLLVDGGAEGIGSLRQG